VSRLSLKQTALLISQVYDCVFCGVSSSCSCLAPSPSFPFRRPEHSPFITLSSMSLPLFPDNRYTSYV